MSETATTPLSVLGTLLLTTYAKPFPCADVSVLTAYNEMQVPPTSKLSFVVPMRTALLLSTFRRLIATLPFSVPPLCRCPTTL